MSGIAFFSLLKFNKYWGQIQLKDVMNPKHIFMFPWSLPGRYQRLPYQEYFCRTDRLNDSSLPAIARLLNEKYKVEWFFSFCCDSWTRNIQEVGYLNLADCLFYHVMLIAINSVSFSFFIQTLHMQTLLTHAYTSDTCIHVWHMRTLHEVGFD